MHFSVVKEDILKYLQYANNFTNTKTLNDILQNIYLSVEGTTVTIKATNYQIGFVCNFEAASSEESGSLTVSCRKLNEIIKELPDGSLIDFNYDGARLNIKSGKSSFKLSTSSAENFPVISEIIPEYILKLSSKTLITLFKRTVFCIPNEIQKLEYSGAQFNVNKNVLEIFATGLQRVAIVSTTFDEQYSNDFIINIPKKTITELIKILENDEEVEIQTDKRQISFKVGNITVYSKLIEKFIKGITRLFTREYPIKAKIDRKAFMEASRRVSTITNEETPGIILSFSDNKLNITSLETIYGTGNEEIEVVEYNSEPFEITLNSRHVNEILNNIETEYFTLEMADKRSPALITPESDDYKYLVVPISFDKI